jgi:hypothetical protein
MSSVLLSPTRSGHPQGREDEGDSGVQSIGTGMVDVTPGDYFELIARQTSASTRTLRPMLTWFAIEVVA